MKGPISRETPCFEGLAQSEGVAQSEGLAQSACAERRSLRDRSLRIGAVVSNADAICDPPNSEDQLGDLVCDLLQKFELYAIRVGLVLGSLSAVTAPCNASEGELAAPVHY